MHALSLTTIILASRIAPDLAHTRITHDQIILPMIGHKGYPQQQFHFDSQMYFDVDGLAQEDLFHQHVVTTINCVKLGSRQV